MYLTAILGGAAIWAGIAQATGRREAWDSPLYFLVGIPVACALSFALALFEPARPWRWGLLPFLGQLLFLLLSEGVGNLLPIGMIVYGVCSVPAILAASLGAFIATQRARRRQG